MMRATHDPKKLSTCKLWEKEASDKVPQLGARPLIDLIFGWEGSPTKIDYSKKRKTHRVPLF